MGAFIFSMNSLLMTTVLGLSEVATGYVMVLLAVCDIVGALIGGRLSDYYGRKKTIIAAMTVETVALILGGIYVRRMIVIFFEAVTLTCFAMFFPVIGAMITDKTGEGKREEEGGEEKGQGPQQTLQPHPQPLLKGGKEPHSQPLSKGEGSDMLDKQFFSVHAWFLLICFL